MNPKQETISTGGRLSKIIPNDVVIIYESADTDTGKSTYLTSKRVAQTVFCQVKNGFLWEIQLFKPIDVTFLVQTLNMGLTADRARVIAVRKNNKQTDLEFHKRVRKS